MCRQYIFGALIYFTYIVLYLGVKCPVPKNRYKELLRQVVEFFSLIINLLSVFFEKTDSDQQFSLELPVSLTGPKTKATLNAAAF